MTRILSRIAALCVALVAAAFVAGCSSSSEDAKGQEQQASTSSSEATNHNAEDVSFAQNMITHHQQALDMAAMAQTSENPQIRTLAGAIIMSQTPEIGIFREWLSEWGAPEMPEHNGHDQMPMSGMVDQATMDKLRTLHGAEFDRLWLQSMIAHHEGAIEMANVEIAKGSNPDAIAIAKTIIADQQAEVDQMKQMLGA